MLEIFKSSKKIVLLLLAVVASFGFVYSLIVFGNEDLAKIVVVSVLGTFATVVGYYYGKSAGIIETENKDK